MDAIADGFDGNGDGDHGFLIFCGVHAQFAVDHGGAHVIGVVGDARQFCVLIFLELLGSCRNTGKYCGEILKL